MKQVPQQVDIPGFEGVYYATIDGMIYRYGKDAPLKPFLHARNYWVNLTVNGNRTHRTVGSIMRMCYFNDAPVVLKHKGLKSDFSYWNLIPVSKSQFVSESNKVKRKGVVKISGQKETFYSSATECAKNNFLDKSTVCKYCNGVHKNTIDGATYMWEEDYWNEYGGDAYGSHTSR